MRLHVWVLLTVLAVGCATPAPQLAPEHREAQETLDQIARARSAVRWFAAIRTSLQAFGSLEDQLHASGRIDEVTHARLEEWVGIVQDAGIAALTAIERAAQEGQATGRLQLSAESVRDLGARVATLSARVAMLTDPIAGTQLSTLIESAAGMIRLVLQTLDPAGIVPLEGAADVAVPRIRPLADATGVDATTHAVVERPSPGVPFVYIPLRVVGPRQLPIPSVATGGVQ